ANMMIATKGPIPSTVAVTDWLVTASSGAASARLPDRPSTPATLAHALAELRRPVGKSSEVYVCNTGHAPSWPTIVSDMHGNNTGMPPGNQKNPMAPATLANANAQ